MKGNYFMDNNNNDQFNQETEERNPFQSSLEDIERQFETLSFRERWSRMLKWLDYPKDSGEYKWAKLELQRKSGPITAIVSMLLAVGILLSIPNDTEVKQRVIAVEYIELDDPPIIEEEPPEPPKEPEFIEPADADFDGPSGEFSPIETTDVVQNEPVSVKPAEMNSVAITKSPITFKGIFGSRTPGARGAALGKYGAGGGDATVYRAMRWLKTKQNADGSWGTDGNHYTAMTGLAILVYLAHGEVPAPDTEFGPTVEKAIRFLCDEQNDAGFFKYKDGTNYSHPIATYALGEAYAMTKNPLVKEAAEKAVVPLIKGQNAKNNWEYNMRVTDRSDTSYAGWCAQAIKAVYTAECEAPGLEECYKRAKTGFLHMYRGNVGGFSYEGNGNQHVGLSGVGALCMQLLGEYDRPEVKNTMKYLEECTIDFEHWENQPYKSSGPSPIYYWYYITQAKFQEGGDTFKKWNAMFFPELQKRQVVVGKDVSGYIDLKGDKRDIGYWDSPSKGESFHDTGKGDLDCLQWENGNLINGAKTTLNRRIMDTCLCSLQLMVYYRFLPSSQLQNEAVKQANDNDARIAPKKDSDVKVKKARKTNRI